MNEMRAALGTDLFNERVAFLDRSHRWSAVELQRYQFEQLRHTLTHAAERVPFYRHTMAAADFDPRAVADLACLQRLPLVDKATIQRDYDAFLDERVDRDQLVTRTTGGSTGVPLTVFMDQDHISRDKANTEYYMHCAGLSIFGRRSVRLYGDRIEPEAIDRGRYWRIEDGRKLVASCYHIDRLTTPAYLAAIDDFQPDYIHSRPSAIHPLCREMRAAGLRLHHRLQGIFLDGEMLPERQWDELEETFGCPVRLIYGHTEGCAVGISFGRERLMHFMPQVGVLELLRPDGSPCREEGERGEIVVTGFNNRVFPLIRYRTYDIGILTYRQSPDAPAYPRLARVEGRLQDYAIDATGNRIPLAPAIFNYNDFDWRGIDEFQVQQHQIGALRFLIQRAAGASESEAAMRKRFLQAMGTILGGGFALELDFVDHIPRSRIGKHRYLDQRLDCRTVPT